MRRDVGADRWAVATLKLDFTGRALLLKSIAIGSLTRVDLIESDVVPKTDP